MKEVSQEEFYKILHLEQKDVITSVQGNFPYTVLFKYMHSSVLFGKSEDYRDGGELKTKYYLPIK